MTTEAELQRTETFDCSPSFSAGIDQDEVSLTPNTQISGRTHEEPSVLESEVEEDTALAVPHPDAFGSHHCPRRQPGHMFHYINSSSNAGGSNHPMELSPRRPQTHINLMCEEDRLRTFSGWRYQETVRKEDLARNGFVYTGTADKVRCVFCNTVLLCWAMGDVVEQEHRRHSPQCPFLRGDPVGNFPMTSGGSASSYSGQAQCQGFTHSPSASHQALATGHGNAMTGAGSAAVGSSQASKHMCSSSPCNPSMAVEHDRLASFRSWPSHLSQKPEQMAHCGLYYTGDRDRVKCFHCDVLLYDWEPKDDPFREHARWFPGCEYLRLVKGDKYLEDVKSNRLTEEDQLESPAVQAVLFAGYSHDLIKKALEALREKSVSGDGVSAELLLKTVMDMEEPGPSAAAQGFSSAEQTGDFQTLQRLHDSLLEKQQCKICMERDVEVIFFPCRHFVCCAACGSGVTACPICRVHIESRDKVLMT